MPARLELSGDDVYALIGHLEFDTVVALWQEARERFARAIPSTIDLSGVERSDSSGVALLVDWLGEARFRGRDLQFVNIPSQMQAIIRVADLEELLPIE